MSQQTRTESGNTQSLFVHRPGDVASSSQNLVAIIKLPTQTVLSPFNYDDYGDACANECALELINLFMLTVCTEVDHVNGDDKDVAALLDSLADEVVKAGLSPNKEGAMLVIVPAFLRFELLPR